MQEEVKSELQQSHEATEEQYEDEWDKPLILTERDFARFIEALNHPKPPSQALIETSRAYK